MTTATILVCADCGKPAERTFDDDFQHTTLADGVACTVWPVVPVMTETAASGPQPAGQIEIDESGGTPRVRFTLPQEWFTLDQLRSYASYLSTVADEASASPEPEVTELMAVINASQARWLPYPESVRVLAGDILDAGYEHKKSIEGGGDR